MSCVTNVSILLKGSRKPVPLEFQDFEIEAIKADNTTNLSLSFDQFTLIGPAAQTVIDFRKQGNIFFGLDCSLLFEQNGTTERFDGYLDLTKDYKELDPVFKGDNPKRVTVTFVDKSSIDRFSEVINGTNYLFLEDKGVFSESDYTDLDWIVEKEANGLDVALMFLAIYVLGEKIIQVIKELAENIATAVGIAGAGVSGSVASLLYQIAVIIIQLVYAALLISLLIKLVFDLISLVISPVYTNKVQSLHSLLSKAIAYFGYELDTNIELLHDFYYQASKGFDDSEKLFIDFNPFPALITKGLPNPQDFGFTLSEMFEIARKCFNARITVIGNKVIFKNEDDPFWTQSSEFKLKDVGGQIKDHGYNTGDLVGTQTFEFITDLADPFTIRNWKGTTFELKTIPKNGDPKKDLIKGLNREIVNVSLCTRKDELNNLEEVVKVLADTADKLASTIGKKGKFKDILGDRIGVAKFGSTVLNVPKLIYLKNGRIPENHRDILGAEGLFTKFHSSKSFIANNFNAQERILENIDNVPMTLSEFKSLVRNTKFPTWKGTEAEATVIKYKSSTSTTTLSYNEKFVYTKQLEEIRKDGTQ